MAKVNKLVPYTLDEILRSEEFFVNLMECSRISLTGHEASFGAYGSEIKYSINAAQKEEKTKCLTGHRRGINYDREGYGLCRPCGENRLIEVHYHPTDSIAVPSTNDLIRLTELRNSPEIEMGEETWQGLNLTDMVGHYSKKTKKNTLFILQEKIIANPTEEFARRINDMIYVKFGGKKEELNFQDRKLPSKISRYLNSTGKYRSKVIEFGNFKEYLKNIDMLKEFKIQYSVSASKYQENLEEASKREAMRQSIEAENQEDMRRLEEELLIPSAVDRRNQMEREMEENGFGVLNVHDIISND